MVPPANSCMLRSVLVLPQPRSGLVVLTLKAVMATAVSAGLLQWTSTLPSPAAPRFLHVVPTCERAKGRPRAWLRLEVGDSDGSYHRGPQW